MIKYITLKKALTWLIAAVVVSALLFTVISFYKKLKQPVENAFSSIPHDVLFFVQIQNPGEFWSKQIATNKVWNNLRAFESPALFISDLAYIRNKAIADSRVKDLFENQKTYISFHPTATSDLAALFTMELPTVGSGNKLIRFATHIRGRNSTASAYTFEGAEVNRIALNDQRKFIYVATESGLFLCSFNKLLLESSLKQLRHGKSLIADPSFNKAKLTAGKKVGAVLFVNAAKLGFFFSSKLNAAMRDNLMPFRFFSQWTALDINLKSDKVTFTGFTIASDSSASFLTTIKKQKALLPGVSAFIPSSSVMIMNVGVADFNGFYNKLNGFYSSHKICNRLSGNMDQFKKIYRFNPLPEIIRHIVNDISFALMEGNDNGDRLFSLVHVDDPDAVCAPLEEASSLTGCHHSEKYKDYSINRVILPCFVPALLKKTINQIDTLFYTVLKDYLVFGYSPESVKKYIDSYSSGQVMSNDRKFLSLSENLFENSNIFIYADFKECVSYFKSIFNDKTLLYIKGNLNRFGCFDEIALQYIYDNDDMNLTNLVVTSNSAFTPPALPLRISSPEPQPEPQNKPPVPTDKNSLVLNLDGPVTAGPYQISEQGSNTSKMVAFDKMNHIYLIDDNDRIIWKKQLSEQPLSKVWQVDYFNNGKQQMLFNTAGYIHIIDMKGNNLPGFPVKLKKRATNGIAVFDYDNNRKYRMLISFDDNRIYNLDINCRPVADWVKVSRPAGVNRSLQFFRIGGKDIITITDNSGNVSFVNRRGEPVMTSVKSLSIPLNSSVFIADNQLITSDKTGKIVIIDKAGKIKSENTGSFSSSYWFISGKSGDVNKQVYVYIDKTTFYIFGTDKKLIFKELLENEIQDKPVFIKASSGMNVLAVYIRKSSKINFYTASGKWNKIPDISGTSLPVIFPAKDKGKMKIAAGSGNKIVIYSF